MGLTVLFRSKSSRESVASSFSGHRWALMLLSLLFFLYTSQALRSDIIWDEWATLHISSGYGQCLDSIGYPTQLGVLPLEQNLFLRKDYSSRNTAGHVTANIFRTENGLGIPYYHLLRGWMQLFGASVLNMRLLSCLIMLLTIVAWYFFLWQVTGRTKVAALGAALIGLNGIVISMAPYLRAYPLGMLGVAVSSIFVWQLAENKKRSRQACLYACCLGITWSIMLFTHFFTAFAFLGQLVFLFWKRISWKHLVIACSFIAITAIVWLLVGGMQRIAFLIELHRLGQERQVLGLYAPTFSGVVSGFAANFSRVVGFATVSSGNNLLINLSGALPAMIVLSFVIWRKEAAMRLCKYVILVQVVAVITYLVIAKFDLLLRQRFWLFTLPFFTVALLLGLQQIQILPAKSWKKILGIMAACLVCIRLSYTVFSHFRYFLQPALHLEQTNLTQQAANKVAGAYQAGDTLLYNNWEIAQRVNILLPESYPAVQKVDTGAPNQMTLIRLGKQTVLELDPL